MKKLLLLLLIIPLMGFSQLDTTTVVVPIKEVAGIKIEGRYKLVREKDGKKEYKMYATFKNTTDKEVFYKTKMGLQNFASLKIKGIGGSTIQLLGDNATKKVAKKKIRIIYPNKTMEGNYFFVQWYNANEVPEFEFELNKEITLENDYSRYN